MTKTTVTVAGIKYNVSVSQGTFGLTYSATGPDGQWVASGGSYDTLPELKKAVKERIRRGSR